MFNLKTVAGDYFSGVILYDPLPKFALKTALWLLKPGTRDWTRSRVLAFGTFGFQVRKRKLIKNHYFLQFEKNICDIRQYLSFIYLVFITFTVTGEFFFKLYLC